MIEMRRAGAAASTTGPTRGWHVRTTIDPELTGRLGAPERMRRIAAYDLFDSGLRERLDAVARDTADRLRAPVSLVSVVLDSAQLMLGMHGVPGWVGEVRGAPAEWALCTQTVLGAEPYLVPDSTDDVLQADNPFVTMAGLRSYAGVPLRDDGGQVLGAHCIIDLVPRVFTDHDIAVLDEGAAQSMRILARYRVS